MERKIVYWNRPLRVKLVAPRNSKKGLEFWGLIVTAILSAVSAIVSAWGASETAKQAKIAQEQLNRGNINSSYEGYITSLGEYCRKLDVTRGEYEYVVVQTEDKRLQVSVVPLLHPARELSLYSDIPDPTTVDQANLIRALESTRLWIPDKFPAYNRSGEGSKSEI